MNNSIGDSEPYVEELALKSIVHNHLVEGALATPDSDQRTQVNEVIVEDSEAITVGIENVFQCPAVVHQLIYNDNLKYAPVETEDDNIHFDAGRHFKYIITKTFLK